MCPSVGCFYYGRVARNRLSYKLQLTADERFVFLSGVVAGKIVENLSLAGKCSSKNAKFGTENIFGEI